MEEIPKYEQEKDEQDAVNLRPVTSTRRIYGLLFEAVYDTNQNCADRLKQLYPRSAYQVIDLPVQV